jgi:LemA protein
LLFPQPESYGRRLKDTALTKGRAAFINHKGSGMNAATLILAILGILVGWLILMYNRLVRLRNMVREGWSGIDVQLKRRSDLVPNLVESVRGYMGHERELLSKVTELRSRSMETRDVREKGRLEGELSRALANVFAVAEGYPDLKANQNFLELQRQLADVEEQLQLARRYYNGTARNLNIQIESFPSNIVAGLFAFAAAEFFEIIDAADRAVPKVAF